MKRLLGFLLTLFMMLAVCGCGRTDTGSSNNVILTFDNMGENIQVTLTEEEAAQVIDILDGNTYAPAFTGVPACGFSEEISLTVGDRIYAIACDTCSTVQDCSKGKYFSIRDGEMAYIHALFENYGGYFPCV